MRRAGAVLLHIVEKLLVLPVTIVAFELPGDGARPGFSQLSPGWLFAMSVVVLVGGPSSWAILGVRDKVSRYHGWSCRNVCNACFPESWLPGYQF